MCFLRRKANTADAIFPRRMDAPVKTNKRDTAHAMHCRRWACFEAKRIYGGGREKSETQMRPEAQLVGAKFAERCRIFIFHPRPPRARVLLYFGTTRRGGGARSVFFSLLERKKTLRSSRAQVVSRRGASRENRI